MSNVRFHVVNNFGMNAGHPYIRHRGQMEDGGDITRCRNVIGSIVNMRRLGRVVGGRVVRMGTCGDDAEDDRSVG